MKPQTSNFHVAIITENAAFQDGATGREIARILRSFADAFETRCDGSERFIVRAQDANGNFCAVADYQPDGRTS